MAASPHLFTFDQVLHGVRSDFDARSQTFWDAALVVLTDMSNWEQEPNVMQMRCKVLIDFAVPGLTTADRANQLDKMAGGGFVKGYLFTPVTGQDGKFQVTLRPPPSMKDNGDK